MSEWVQTHQPCESCGSSDGASLNTEGWWKCFVCEKNWKEDSMEEASEGCTPIKSKKIRPLMRGNCVALRARALTEETTKKFGYMIAEGGRHQAAPYRGPDGKHVVAQKLRGMNKKFDFVGDKKDIQLFGQHLWPDTGKMVVITEGEIDALSVSQAQGNKWPVVSLINGSSGAVKDLKRQIKWLNGYEKIILMFDDDEAGRKATEKAVKVLPMGKAYIATIPGFNDANDALKAGKERDIVSAIWQAKAWSPDGVVSASDLIEDAMKAPVEGLPWWDDRFGDTYGRRHGELYALGAGTGVGKTDWVTEQIAYDIKELGLSVGALFLEQQPVETVKRIAGKIDSKIYHIPITDQKEIDDRNATLRGTLTDLGPKLRLYDSWGNAELDDVISTIRFMESDGTRVFYLDHLTAMADPSNERESLELIMKALASLANELRVIIIFVSHLATPDGTPHEEGGSVMIRHFKGSRSIGFWSFLMIGLERDTQTIGSPMCCKVLKDRYTGRSTGVRVYYGYDRDTGRLIQCDPPEEDSMDDESTSF